MDTLEAIRTWKSTRKFQDRPVEEEKLEAVLEAVRRAPSWANMRRTLSFSGSTIIVKLSWILILP